MEEASKQLSNSYIQHIVEHDAGSMASLKEKTDRGSIHRISIWEGQLEVEGGICKDGAAPSSHCRLKAMNNLAIARVLIICLTGRSPTAKCFLWALLIGTLEKSIKPSYHP